MPGLLPFPIRGRYVGAKIRFLFIIFLFIYLILSKTNDQALPINVICQSSLVAMVTVTCQSQVVAMAVYLVTTVIEPGGSARSHGANSFRPCPYEGERVNFDCLLCRSAILESKSVCISFCC